jgi:hypothetical protein
VSAAESFAHRAPVVICTSGLTDIRSLAARLDELGVRYHVERFGMGSSEARDAFRALQAEFDWHTLPMVFVSGRFVGGEPELARHPITGGAEPAQIQRVARWLGVGGLLPFLAGIVALLTGRVGDDAFFALAAYAAVILSFVGAVHWGAALWLQSPKPAREFAASVVPALVAWVALLLPQRPGLALLTVAFAGWYAWERYAIWRWYPRWFSRLRTLLTSVVCGCLLLALII